MSFFSDLKLIALPSPATLEALAPTEARLEAFESLEGVLLELHHFALILQRGEELRHLRIIVTKVTMNREDGSLTCYGLSAPMTDGQPSFRIVFIGKGQTGRIFSCRLNDSEIDPWPYCRSLLTLPEQQN